MSRFEERPGTPLFVPEIHKLDTKHFTPIIHFVALQMQHEYGTLRIFYLPT